ncbi:MAG: bifunctional phosphopantothenoylcysteine decarboxylase/phosphopantothenate synthase [Armatimonadota bacterium]|nr:bifunctional phosphopantothenoylcysteine decarboxylase/phosphopantothenate synthase [Armatimonadota bacterium]
MKFLITGGNTTVPIDRVRHITNGFSGRTGASIARCAHEAGHDVTLLTSRPESLGDLIPSEPSPERWRTLRYETFDDLMTAMQKEIQGGQHDVVIHSAAVSDYRVADTYMPAAGVYAVQEGSDMIWRSEDGMPLRLVSAAAGKVKSNAPELWLRLIPTPKIIDCIRSDWGFGGVLVKFKLEVGVEERELLDIAERSRQHSGADLMVANTLETAPCRAYIGPTPEGYTQIVRRALPSTLLERVMAVAEARGIL